MVSEYQSLTSQSEAVRPLSDQEFRELVGDPPQKVELIPGRALFAKKASQGQNCGMRQLSEFSRPQQGRHVCVRRRKHSSSAPYGSPRRLVDSRKRLWYGSRHFCDLLAYVKRNIGSCRKLRMDWTLRPEVGRCAEIRSCRQPPS